jgi:L-2,4-diaminobutyrate decarboxylase
MDITIDAMTRTATDRFSSTAVEPRDAARMHRFDPETAGLAELAFAFVRDRLRGDRPPVTSAPSRATLDASIGESITADGIGAERTFGLFTDVIERGCIPIDHAGTLAFVGQAAAISATLADVMLSAAGISADWWVQGGGAIHVENEALRWLAAIAGLPAGAGGTFLSGGTIANLTGLHVGRWTRRADAEPGARLAIAATSEAHSSIRLSARVLGVDILTVPGDERGRMTASALTAALAQTDLDVFAVAATAGCTNTGEIDDLSGIARVCREHDLWFHVDGAYGAGALASERARPRFAGVELADSLVIDPHKWLFVPMDCSAILYRDPELARRANTQAADYLDPLDGEADWNPSDYGIHMTRRARGFPLWFAVATHGTIAFGDAIDACIGLAEAIAAAIERHPALELVAAPVLSVVLFRRRGWTRERYDAWSLAIRRAGLGLVVPTLWHGEPVLRFCFVNPRTTLGDVERILDTLTIDVD